MCSWNGGEDGCPLLDPVAVAVVDAVGWSPWSSDPDGGVSYALHVGNLSFLNPFTFSSSILLSSTAHSLKK